MPWHHSARVRWWVTMCHVLRQHTMNKINTYSSTYTYCRLHNNNIISNRTNVPRMYKTICCRACGHIFVGWWIVDINIASECFSSCAEMSLSYSARRIGRPTDRFVKIESSPLRNTSRLAEQIYDLTKRQLLCGKCRKPVTIQLSPTDRFSMTKSWDTWDTRTAIDKGICSATKVN